MLVYGILRLRPALSRLSNNGGAIAVFYDVALLRLWLPKHYGLGLNHNLPSTSFHLAVRNGPADAHRRGIGPAPLYFRAGSRSCGSARRLPDRV